MTMFEGGFVFLVLIGFVTFMYVAMKGWEDSDDGYF